MKIKEISLDIPANSFHLNMCLLNKDGKVSFMPRACKEEIFYAVARDTAWRKARKNEDVNTSMLGPWTKGKIDRRRPKFLIYVHSMRNEAAKRILKIMDLLSEYQKLRKPKVWLVKNTHAILIATDPFYINSPIAVSAALTFIRGAARTGWSFETLEIFIDRIRSDKTKYSWDSWLHSDAEHINQAFISGTLQAFLDKKLKCLNMKRFEAFRYGWFDYENFILDGIRNYDSSENYSKITAKDITKALDEHYR